MSTFDAIAKRLSVCDTPETLAALGRVLARQFATTSDDAALFRLRLAMDERRATLARLRATRPAGPRSSRGAADLHRMHTSVGSASPAAVALPASDDNRPAYVFYFADNARAAVFHHAGLEHPNARAAIERLRSRGYIVARWPENTPLPRSRACTRAADTYAQAHTLRPGHGARNVR